jgi:CBS domain-containing protein
MTISTLLQAKGTSVVTIRPEAPVTELLAELIRHRIGSLVVSSDGEHIEGIVSERDVVRSLQKVGATLLEQQVASIMTTTVHTCSPSDEIESLMVLMTERRVRHVPVVDQGVLAGIVSIGDVVKSRIVQLERDRNSLIDYITTGR